MIDLFLLQIIAGCAKTREGFTKAKVFIEEIKNSNLVQDAVIYGAIMNVCAAHGLEKEAEETFKEMYDAGFTPNLFHFSSLLNTYASRGKHERAEQVLQQIRAAGLHPNLVLPFFYLQITVEFHSASRCKTRCAITKVSGSFMNSSF